MTLSHVHAGDIVEVDVKGRRSFALVLGRIPGGLRISARAVNRGLENHQRVSARQVVGHYRRSKGTAVARVLEQAGAPILEPAA